MLMQYETKIALTWADKEGWSTCTKASAKNKGKETERKQHIILLKTNNPNNKEK